MTTRAAVAASYPTHRTPHTRMLTCATRPTCTHVACARREGRREGESQGGGRASAGGVIKGTPEDDGQEDFVGVPCSLKGLKVVSLVPDIQKGVQCYPELVTRSSLYLGA